MKKVIPICNEINLPELTLRGILLGMIITVIFTASNVYLGLKVGMTFSSAIPAAVISMTILKMFKDSNILENNMVQTQSSGAGSIATVIFIVPGMLMLGYWQEFPFWQTMMICACGGALGVLFTIPLRRVMVTNSDLPYPEGVAAAEILKAGSGNQSKDSSLNSGLRDIMCGGILSATISLLSGGFRVISSEVSYWFSVGSGISQISLGFSSALLGAGYLIGISGGMSIFVGVILGWGIFVPYLTSSFTLAEGQSMQALASVIWQDKVRFIGAGVIGISAVWTVITLTKPIIDGMRLSIQAMEKSRSGSGLHRLDTDISPKTIGLLLLLILIGLIGTFYVFIADAGLSVGLTWSFVTAGILIVFIIGFFVAATCGYMAGLIGTSSSPVSGIGILGVIISALIILVIGTYGGLFNSAEGTKFATAFTIFIMSVIMSIASVSNDNLQDLKAGQLVGATPWKQQVALLLGSAVGSFAIAPILNLLYEAYGFVGAMPRSGMDETQVLSAPQAVLMTTISKGIFSYDLEWSYVLLGVGLGIAFITLDVLLRKNSKHYCLPPLAIGTGIYLPPSIQMPLVIGAFAGYLAERQLRKRLLKRNSPNIEAEVEDNNRRGVLLASGFIVGESVIGVIIAGIIVWSVTSGGSDAPLALTDGAGITGDLLGLAIFIGLIIVLIRRVISSKN